MRKFKLKWLFTLVMMVGIFFISNIPIKAETINLGGKRQSIYEISEAYISGNNLILKGWMFVDRQQHYQNKSNYRYELIVGGQTYSDLKNHNVNMTDYFDINGVTAWCPEPYPPNYDANNCNMRYDNVGFSFSVPLSAITTNSTPEIRMVDKWNNIHQHQIKFAKNIATTVVGDYQYNFNSSLDNAQFRITHEQVIVRQNPSPSSSWWGGGSGGVITNGSPTANWLVNMYYTGVLDTRVVNGVTWYRTNLNFSWRYHASAGTKWYGIPGNSGKTAWIPSTFLALQGQNFTISVNKRPDITGSNQSFNIKDWNSDLWSTIQFRDRENTGNVWQPKSHNNTVSNNASVTQIRHSDGTIFTTAAQMKTKPGTYTITYTTRDSGSFSRSFTRTITLTNNAPTVSAPNITRNIKDWGGNLWEGISYSDYEGHTITSTSVTQIRHSDGTIFTTAAQMKTKPGTYTVSYRVIDQHGATTNISRTITLTSNAPTIQANPQHFTVTLGKNPSGGTWQASDIYYGMTIRDYEDTGNGWIGYPSSNAVWNNMSVTIRNSSNQTVSAASLGTTRGTYTATYTTRDSHGTVSNTYTRTIIVNALSTLNLRDFYVIEGTPFANGNEINGVGYDMFYDDVNFPNKLTAIHYPATANDPEDGNISNKIVVTNIKNPSGTNVLNVSTNFVGVYTVTYSVTDSHGGVSTGTRRITVLPSSTPVVNATDRYFFRGSEVTKNILLQKVIATDKYDGNIIQRVDVLNFDAINPNVTGEYSITYTVTNTSNKTATKAVKVFIIDTVADEKTKSWVRYINKDYIDTLDSKSSWRLNSEMHNELVTSLNKVPSDTTAIQVWQFSSEDVKKVKEFGRTNTFSKEVNQQFINMFGSNRKK